MSYTRTLILISTLFGAVSPAVAQPINSKVVKFCKDNLGAMVGDGECSTLADAALDQAGAKPRTAFKESPTEGDYVWGKLAFALETKDNSLKKTTVPKMNIQPGDVIQFRDTRFEGKNLRVCIF